VKKDNSLVFLGPSLSLTELWRPLSPKQQELAKPARLELNPPAVALTAKFDYWRTFSSTAVVIVLSKLTTLSTHKLPRSFSFSLPPSWSLSHHVGAGSQAAYDQEGEFSRSLKFDMGGTSQTNLHSSKGSTE
jgi:hypothetical protein